MLEIFKLRDGIIGFILLLVGIFFWWFKKKLKKEEREELKRKLIQSIMKQEQKFIDVAQKINQTRRYLWNRWFKNS